MSQETAPLRIAIAGLGTVGCGVIDVLQTNAALIAQRCGRSMVISGVSARDRHRDRPVDISALPWFDDGLEMADPAISDVVVELIGGSDGPALALARKALGAGLGFVTANKALIAHHGAELAELAEANNATLRFEAAVAAAIPVLKALREGLSANTITSLHGILNGTCNFILTKMEEAGESFDEVLAEAQRLGYAEADPTFDIDGIDTAHKTAILASLAYGTKPDLDNMVIEGIRHVTQMDIDFASNLGYRIKLLGSVSFDEDRLSQRVRPCLVPEESAMAHVGGATNAVIIHTDFAGDSVLEGQGAGAGPTASAVVGDVIDIARGADGSGFSVPAADMTQPEPADVSQQTGEFYLRIKVSDEIGVLAALATTLKANGISVERLIQFTDQADGEASLIITTHEATEAQLSAAVDALKAADFTLAQPVVLRIVE